MAQLQLAFDKAAENKNRKTILKINLKDILEQDSAYTQVQEQLAALGEKRKQILQSISDAYPELFNELAELAAAEKNDKELLTDLAVNSLASGEPIEVKDHDGNPLEPVFSVKFKKVK
jgi:hypothetical protein